MKSLVTVQLGSEIVFSLQDLSVEDDCRQIRTYLSTYLESKGVANSGWFLL